MGAKINESGKQEVRKNLQPWSLTCVIPALGVGRWALDVGCWMLDVERFLLANIFGVRR